MGRKSFALFCDMNQLYDLETSWGTSADHDHYKSYQQADAMTL